jgi:putative protease
MISEFEKRYNTKPNLEMIVYGHAHLMNTKYCPLKVNNLCGKCRSNQYVIKDNYGEFSIISHPDCTTTIVNGRPLNLLDEINYLPDAITTFRLQFTIESKEETKEIILKAMEKLNGSSEKLFDSNTQTRGHFNKEIM